MSVLSQFLGSFGTTLQGSGTVTLTSAAVALTYGAYSQMIASLTAPTKAVTIQLTKFTGAPGGAVRVFAKLAQGAGGAEVDVPGFPHLQATWNNLSTGNNPAVSITFAGLQLAAGTRLTLAITNADGATVIGCDALLVCVE